MAVLIAQFLQVVAGGSPNIFQFVRVQPVYRSQICWPELCVPQGSLWQFWFLWLDGFRTAKFKPPHTKEMAVCSRPTLFWNYLYGCVHILTENGHSPLKNSKSAMYLAASCCLAAHIRITSGTSSVHNINLILPKTRRKEPSFGLGILGWTVLHVQMKSVKRQLQMISNCDLFLGTTAMGDGAESIVDDTTGIPLPFELEKSMYRACAIMSTRR